MPETLEQLGIHRETRHGSKYQSRHTVSLCHILRLQSALPARGVQAAGYAPGDSMSSASDFEFHWATPEDEPDIRSLVGSVTMPGTVAIRFSREPDYFLGTTIMGDPCDVLVARHRPGWSVGRDRLPRRKPGLSQRAGITAWLYRSDPGCASLSRPLAGQPWAQNCLKRQVHPVCSILG